MPLTDSPTSGMGSAPPHAPYDVDRERGHVAHAHAYGPPVAVEPLGMLAKRGAKSREREDETPRKITARASPGPGVLISMGSTAGLASEHIPSDALNLPLGAGKGSAHLLHLPFKATTPEPSITDHFFSL